MWLKQCILIATRISKFFNVVFKHHSDEENPAIRDIFFKAPNHNTRKSGNLSIKGSLSIKGNLSIKENLSIKGNLSIKVIVLY